MNFYIIYKEIFIIQRLITKYRGDKYILNKYCLKQLHKLGIAKSQNIIYNISVIFGCIRKTKDYSKKTIVL